MQDNNIQQPDPLARRDIPDAWAKSGRCPACQAAALQVVHLSNATDFMICAQCELSFEVALSGGKIRVKNVPDPLGFMEEELRYHWIEPPILSNYFANRLGLMELRARIASSAGSLSDEEVLKRATDLHIMGNKPKMVEFILIQAGATPAQAQAAFVSLKQRAEQDAQEFTRKIRLIGGTILLIVFVLAAAWEVTPILISAQVRDVLDSPAGNVTHHPSLFLWLLNNGLPDMLKPRYLRFAPAQVRFVGPEQAQCPVRSAEAAALFGGSGDYWSSINQSDGWQMESRDASIPIRVPGGMYAAFVDNQAREISTVLGPVTISHVSFIAIRCH